MKPIKRKYKPTIVCDKCHKSIGKIKPSYKKVGEIEYRYWRCRHCSTVYVISATDMTLLTAQTKILKQIAIKFVTDAEGECGAGTGIIKLSEVVAKMYAYLPSVVRILFTEKQLVQIAESVLAEAKKKWEANENLATYIENKQQTTPAVVTLAENTK